MKKTSDKIITIGTFDGVHVGHRKILDKVRRLGHSSNLETTVLTLFPHPRMVLQPEVPIKLLHTIDERIELLKSYGIDNVVVKEFNRDFANLSPLDYVKLILVDELNTKQIVIGYDHHFGKNRSANIKDLLEFSKIFDFEVEQIPAQDIEAVTVSSTKIRNALELGKVDLANAYLGYNYFITGEIVKGKGLGRTIDFPTANVHIAASYKLIPKDGVYVVSAILNSKTIYGMMNIGTNPTVEGKTRSIEVHFFNFNQDIYNHKIRISFLKRLRSEEKFKDLEALKLQLHQDMNTAKLYISNLDD